MDIQFFDEESRFKYRCAAIIIENNHLLLHKVYDYWTPPGGKVLVMENSRVSVERELFEESGERINVLQHLFTSETFYNRHGFPHHELCIYYLAESKDLWNRGQTIVGDEGGRPIEYQWVPVDELSTIDVQPAFILDYIHDLKKTPPHIIVDER